MIKRSLRQNCLSCGDAAYGLSHRRNLLEHALSLFGIRPVRCVRCRERRFAFRPFRTWSF